VGGVLVDEQLNHLQRLGVDVDGVKRLQLDGGGECGGGPDEEQASGRPRRLRSICAPLFPSANLQADSARVPSENRASTVHSLRHALSLIRVVEHRRAACFAAHASREMAEAGEAPAELLPLSPWFAAFSE